jgi:hypothetical protein
MQLASASITGKAVAIHTLPTICARTNPAPTGFWGPDQDFAEQRWNDFCTQHLPKAQTYATKAQTYATKAQTTPPRPRSQLF